MGRASEITCRTIQVKDTKNDKIYTPEQYNSDPALKKYIERRISENIAMVLGAVVVSDENE